MWNKYLLPFQKKNKNNNKKTEQNKTKNNPQPQLQPQGLVYWSNLLGQGDQKQTIFVA